MSVNKVIVVPLIGSGDARAAVSIGRRAAMTRQAMLQLLYITEQEESPSELISRFRLVPEDLFNAVVQQVNTVKENYDKVILDAAARAEVEMLIFSYGDDVPFLTKSLLENCTCPVLLVQSELGHAADRPIEHLLVPVDCTPSSAAAIEPAVRLAAETGATLHVLHLANRESANEPGSLPIGPYMDQPQYEWSLWMREFWDRFIVCVKQIAPHVVPQLHVTYGEIDQEILHFVQNNVCDLVTMTTNADSNLMNTLISKLSCPLLLVQPSKATIEECNKVQSTVA